MTRLSHRVCSGQFSFDLSGAVLQQFKSLGARFVLITGLIGLVWGVVWYVLYRDPLQHRKVNQAELDYIERGGGSVHTVKSNGKATWSWTNVKQVFSSRTLWGVYIGQFAVNATLWFFLTWFPTYLVQYRGLDFIKSGYLASVPFLAACAGCFCQVRSDRCIQERP